MKPIQQHKDPRITNISFDNFTGSICIITSQSDDEETKDLMLSSSQTNAGTDLFKPNHHLTLITQPILGARSRKKDKSDSITNSRRSSLNDSPSLILPINRIEKFQHEKKSSHYESSDSGLDFSLSTNSSVQYPQQHATIHRPLSVLNEDSNTDEGFHDQPLRFPVVNLGRRHSIEHTINNNNNNKQERSFSNEQEKLIKKSNDDLHSNPLTDLHQQTNLNRIEFLHRPPPPPSSVSQYHSLNDFPNQSHIVLPKQNKSSRKKAKLNIIVEPSVPFSSSHLNLNDEQIHSITRIASSSSNQTTSRNPSIKLKSISPLGHYPNQEQIRARINRSVIERQHPPNLPNPSRKGVIQQTIPFDASPSKVNNLLFRQQKQSTNIYHSDPNILGGGSTIQNAHIVPFRQTKQTLPGLYNEVSNDDHWKNRNRWEKRRLNDRNKWQENSQKEQVRTKDIQQPSKTHQKRQSRQDQIDQFLTSTPRRHFEQSHFKPDQLNDKGPNINRRQQPTHLAYESKPNGLVIQNRDRTMNQNNEFEAEYSPRNTIAPFQSRPKKLIRIGNVHNQTEQNSRFYQREKSPSESINTLLQTTRIQPMHVNHFRRENEINRLSKTNLTQFNKAQKPANRFFQGRSPTSCSVISDHQQQYDQYQTSSSSSSSHNELTNDKSTRTYRFNVIDEQQPLDGRYVIPTNSSQLPTFVDSASQTSSRHTYPFTCRTDPNDNNAISIDNSPRDLIVPHNSNNMFNHRICSSSSSVDHFSPNDRFPLSLGKVTIAMEKEDISTNDNSDDGWSDDSAELIYVDERYLTQTKKNISSSSSSSHLNSQHQTVLLQ